jgi:hypothetical protein
MAVSRFVKVTEEEKSEIKIIIHLRLGDYREIFTSTSSRLIFPDNHLAFGE